MEKEIKLGEIQYIKPDRKSFKIEDIWYNNKFKVLPDEIQKGDNVKIEFVSKDYKNFWQKIFIEEKIVKKFEETKELPIKEIKETTNEETILPKYISDTTINTLIMSMKDIYLSDDNADDIEKIAERLVKGYKKIRLLV